MIEFIFKLYLIIWEQVRVADPIFLGYFIDKGVSAATKVVRKVIKPLLIIFCSNAAM